MTYNKKKKVFINKLFRKVISINLVLCLIVSMLANYSDQVVYGADNNNLEKDEPFSDTQGHWAEELIKKQYEKGMLSGYPDGTFKPDKQIKRAELITLINRYFGLKEKSNSNYKDVSNGAWYVGETAKAKYYGYLEELQARAEEPATREDVVIMLNLILDIEEQPAKEEEKEFSDLKNADKNISKTINKFSELGYIYGYDDGSFRPENTITRAEIITMTENVLGYIVTSQEDVDNMPSDVDKVTIINPNIILEGKEIKGDLYISPGVNGKVTIKNTKITGQIDISGGTLNEPIELDSVEAGRVVVTKAKQASQIIIKGQSKFDEVKVKSETTIGVQKDSTIEYLDLRSSSQISGLGSIKEAYIGNRNVIIESRPDYIEIDQNIGEIEIANVKMSYENDDKVEDNNRNITGGYVPNIGDTNAPIFISVDDGGGDNVYTDGDTISFLVDLDEVGLKVTANLSVINSYFSEEQELTDEGDGTYTYTTIDIDTNNSMLEGNEIVVVFTAEDLSGNITTDNSLKLYLDKTAPTDYKAVIDQTRIDSSNQDALSFTILGAELDATYTYSLNDTNSATPPITGSGTVTSTTIVIDNLDVSSFDDGRITLLVSLTDTLGNTGPNVMSSVKKDLTAPVPGNNGNLLVSYEDGEVTVSWSEAIDTESISSALQYLVYYSDSNNLNTVIDTEVSGTSVDDYESGINCKIVKGLELNNTYYFNVIVKDEEGNKAIYNTTSVNTDELEFKIYTIEDLAKVGTGIDGWGLDKDYKLMANLDFNNADSYGNQSISGKDWNGDGNTTESIKAQLTTGVGFKPIGNSQSPFTGTFEGNGYTISNLYINRPNDDYQGLFGYATSTSICNLGLVNAEITGNNFVGGLIGNTTDSGIQTCYFDGVIIGTGDNIAGLVGSSSTSIIEDCYSTSDINGSNYVGGLIGNSDRSSIYNTYTIGGIEGNSGVGGIVGNALESEIMRNFAFTSALAGEENIYRIAGINSGSSLEDNYANKNMTINTSSVVTTISSYSDTSADGYNLSVFTNISIEPLVLWDFIEQWEIKAGASRPTLMNVGNDQRDIMITPDLTIGNNGNIVAYNEMMTSVDLSWIKAIDNESSRSNIEYLIYYSTSNSINTVAEIEANGVLATFDTDINGVTVESLEPDTVYYFNIIARDEKGNKTAYNAVQKRTKERYKKIYSIEDLLRVGSGIDGWDLDKDYMLMENLDFNDDSSYLNPNEVGVDWNGDGSTAESIKTQLTAGVGFNPIGNSSAKFTGTFNGNGYTISNLYINRTSSDDQGLFGYTNNATIEKVGLKNCSVTGKDYVGGILGRGSGTSAIINSYTSGMITGVNYVGGLAGSSPSLISSSFSMANVLASEDYAGGLSGRSSLSTIQNCYTTGNVEVGVWYSGGITATAHYTTIQNCYATGTITADLKAGGLVAETSYEVLIENSIAYSDVLVANWSPFGTRTAYRIANILSSEEETLSNNYAKESMLVHGSVKDSVDANSEDGANIASMINTGSEPLSNWDFVNIWEIRDGANTPTLQDVTIEETVDETGISLGDNGSIISGNKTTSSIELNWTTSTDDTSAASALQYLVYYSENNTLTSVSQTEEYGTAFGGYVTDINSTTVTGLSPDTSYYFNVIVKDEAGNKKAYVPIHINTEAPTFEISYIEDLIKIGTGSWTPSSNYVLLRDLDFDDDDSYLSPAIKHIFTTGDGFTPLGDENNPFTGTFDGNGYTISNLYINRQDNDYQGLFGVTDGAIIKNIGLIGNHISGKNYIGALVGKAKESRIENTYASGTVKGISNVGGISGRAFASFIQNSYVAGNISASYGYVGGVVGEAFSSTITNTYSQGAISGDRYVGGLVGNAVSGTIENSVAYNESITGEQQVARVVSQNTGIVTNTFAKGTMLVNGVLVEDSLLNGTSISTMIDTGIEPLNSWDFTNIWEIKVGGIRPTLKSIVGDEGKDIDISSPLPGNSGAITWVNKTKSSIELRWTKATDNISLSQSLKYIVYYTKDSMLTNIVDIEANGIAVGSYEEDIDSKVVSGLLPDSEYYFYVVVKDTKGNKAKYVTLNQRTEDGYKLISTIEDLLKIGSGDSGWDINSKYKLVRDLDFNDSASYSNPEATGVDWNGNGNNTESIKTQFTSGVGFKPICYGNSFSGIFDGNGFTISNLYINRPDEDYQGLFGSISHATVHNVGLVDARVIGKSNVGGLVGASVASTIENSYVTGMVTSMNTYGGGVIGKSSSDTIRNCYSISNVTGNNQVGGIVGNSDSGNISNSYHMGTIYGTSYVGGIVGNNINGSAVENCLAYSSAISGEHNIRRIVGDNSGNLVNNFGKNTMTLNQGGIVDIVSSNDSSSIEGADITSLQDITKEPLRNWDFTNIWEVKPGYSRPTLMNVNNDTVDIIEEPDLTPGEDGLITVTNVEADSVDIIWSQAMDNDSLSESLEYLVYYSQSNNISTVVDMETNGIEVGSYETNNLSKTIGELEPDTTYYLNIIVRDEAGNRAAYEMVSIKTEEFAYEIYTVEDLLKIGSGVDGWNLDANYKLMKDIDFNDDNSYMDANATGIDWNGDGNNTETIKYQLTNGLGFMPIGDDSNHFTGSFNGNGFKIKNLYINRPTESNQGLFGFIESATIENVGLKTVNVDSKIHVGGLVGSASFSTINNCFVTGAMEGQHYVGLLVGSASFTTISNCYTTGNIAGFNNLGGLVGGVGTSSVINSYSTSSVNGWDYIGGLIGRVLDSTISGCLAYNDTISGYDYIGKVAGYGENATVLNTYSRYYIRVTIIPTDDYVNPSPIEGQRLYHNYNFSSLYQPLSSWDFENIWELMDGKERPTLIHVVE